MNTTTVQLEVETFNNSWFTYLTASKYRNLISIFQTMGMYFQTMGYVFPNHGICISKPWDLYFQTMGSVFPDPWDLYFQTMGYVFPDHGICISRPWDMYFQTMGYSSRTSLFAMCCSFPVALPNAPYLPRSTNASPCTYTPHIRDQRKQILLYICHTKAYFSASLFAHFRFLRNYRSSS